MVSLNVIRLILLLFYGALFIFFFKNPGNQDAQYREIGRAIEGLGTDQASSGGTSDLAII
jgi:hypothetical protein